VKLLGVYKSFLHTFFNTGNKSNPNMRFLSIIRLHCEQPWVGSPLSHMAVMNGTQAFQSTNEVCSIFNLLCELTIFVLQCEPCTGQTHC
jgi:hypothetical protein